MPVDFDSFFGPKTLGQNVELTSKRAILMKRSWIVVGRVCQATMWQFTSSLTDWQKKLISKIIPKRKIVSRSHRESLLEIIPKIEITLKIVSTKLFLN